MLRRELPLLVFTLLIQMTVGIVLLEELFLLEGTAAPGYPSGILCAFVLYALAMLISLCHLGKPVHSPMAVLNVRTSWLSREIASAVLAGLLLARLAWIRLLAGRPDQGHAEAILFIAAGFFLVHAMARIYRQETIPGWNTRGTPFTFFASVFVLGSSWQAAAAGISGGQGGIFVLQAAYCTGLALAAAAVPFMLRRKRPEDNPAALAASLPLRTVLHVLHLAMLAAGLVLLLAGMPAGGAAAPLLLCAAFACALAGEAAGRAVFYLSYSRKGL